MPVAGVTKAYIKSIFKNMVILKGIKLTITC